MNTLDSELQRLYRLDAPSRAESSGLDPIVENGMTRAMVVSFLEAKDWQQVAGLYQAVQGDLQLPAPGVSVSGNSGYQLWFSLADPIPQEQARAFLSLLQARYLADIQEKNLSSNLETEHPSTLAFPPRQHGTSGKWSAFIDPSMGDMFVEEPGLEMAPNMARQADRLAALESISPVDFAKALLLLQTDAAAGTDAEEEAAVPLDSCPHQADIQPQHGNKRRRQPLSVGDDFNDPFAFLLAVMNDSAASGRSRISAAKALLPYFRKKIV